MALITSISGVPLYSSIQEALNWGAARGLNGYHTHVFQDKLGYMGGATHSEVNVAVARRPVVAQQAVIRRVVPQVNIPQPQVVQQPTPTPVSPTYSSGGSGGGGGY